MVALAYAAAVADEGEDGVTVTFRDLPEAITGAATREAALVLARDALAVELETRLIDRGAVPAPSAREAGELWVSPPARIAAKALILHLMQRGRMKAAALAERMRLPPSEINRILDPRHRTGLDRLEQAVEALGGELGMVARMPDEPVVAGMPAHWSADPEAAAAAVEEIMADAGRRIVAAVRAAG